MSSDDRLDHAELLLYRWMMRENDGESTDDVYKATWDFLMLEHPEVLAIRKEKYLAHLNNPEHT